AVGVPPRLRWASAIGLLLLAYTAGFASIDWVLSLDPHFWSAIFPMILGTHWSNTCVAVALTAVAVSPSGVLERSHLRDLASILLATVTAWAHVEFCQFLIVWAANLTHEIPWYMRRIPEGSRGATRFIAIAGFDGQRAVSVAMQPPALPPDPQQDLAQLRAREEQLLTTYHRIDRGKGTVHPPIAEARRRVAAEGVDGFPQAGR